MLPHPSCNRRSLDGAQSIAGEPEVRNLTGPPALYYLRARYYNALTGRFMSKDPEDATLADPKTLHRYLYVNGDPVDLVDPTGRSSGEATAPGRPAVGGAIGEYVVLTLKIAVAEIASVEAVACALNIQYSMDALKTVGETNVVPVVQTCTAKGECPPCDPPPDKGTWCGEFQSGHTHGGFDPHFHLFLRNQRPSDCRCFWNEQNGPGGATGALPPNVRECTTYPSWVAEHGTP